MLTSYDVTLWKVAAALGFGIVLAAVAGLVLLRLAEARTGRGGTGGEEPDAGEGPVVGAGGPEHGVVSRSGCRTGLQLPRDGGPEGQPRS